jgi:hypothetical protein
MFQHRQLGHRIIIYYLITRPILLDFKIFLDEFICQYIIWDVEEGRLIRYRKYRCAEGR